MNLNSVSDSNKSTVLRLMGIKGGTRCFSFNSQRDRFDMLHCADTSVRKELNANRIVINNSNIAIASQYPYQHQLENHLQMLVENRTPALVILASNSDMMKHDLPDYFSHSSAYGKIQTQSSLLNKEDLGDGIAANIYQLGISGYEATIDIPVVHVHNWPDHQTVSPETTSKLVALIEHISADKRSFYKKRRSRAIHDLDKLLPVIHCRAGVGRTGQTIAAMAMNKYPGLDLATITQELRASRNNYMIQTPVQMETLVKLMQSR